ncbi:hypothetical protein [Variovorax sp. UC122_21]|uniref:hypothetical protein n=1 Tax=Variovorax sp. UC122_21 TaxID=3374554 RepID=UPI00375821F8
MREQKGFGALKGGYHFDLEGLTKSTPFVFKTSTGAGSTGVALVESEKKLAALKRQYFRVSYRRMAINFVRRLRLTREQYSIYEYRNKKFKTFNWQDFISGLDCDYKILVFGNRFYSLRRQVRKNDFRASGSGIFSHETPPLSALDFARSIFLKLDVPYLSLDIAISSDSCKLIEYQVLNFGPLTLTASPGHHYWVDNKWHYMEGKADLEENFSTALALFLRERHAVSKNSL